MVKLVHQVLLSFIVVGSFAYYALTTERDDPKARRMRLINRVGLSLTILSVVGFTLWQAIFDPASLVKSLSPD